MYPNLLSFEIINCSFDIYKAGMIVSNVKEKIHRVVKEISVSEMFLFLRNPIRNLLPKLSMKKVFMIEE